jgi:hypothetical protein
VELEGGVGRPEAMPTLMRPAALAALGLVVVTLTVGACRSPGADPLTSPSTGPSTSPSASVAPSSAIGEIEHKTGATDVVLRYDQGGGFVQPAFLASQAPIFTLYGDGTIIFRNPAKDPPAPVGNVYPNNPFRIAKLSEEQILALLTMSIGEGGLGAARANYENAQVADASTAIFTISAGGMTKTVSVYALGIESQPGDPDTLARAAFAKLGERLGNFDQNGAFPTQEYKPERYRGILMEGMPGDPEAKKWPWDDVKPADFVLPADPNAFQLATKTLTIAQAEKLGITPYQGGFQGPSLIGPDGKFYSFSLRPLLPDDAS